MITHVDPVKTENLNVDLPESAVKFIRAYAKAKSSSVVAVLDDLIKTLQKMEEQKIHPAIMAMVGILPADLDVDAARLEYLRKKHLKDEGQS